MNLYLAESGNIYRYVAQQCGESVFAGLNILHSFYYCDEWVERVIVRQAGRFLLDSGAFTFMTSAKGQDVNWNEYIEKYIDFIRRNNVQHYFELDIDSVVGYERVKQIRHMLEKGTGRPCIPVWHKSRGYNEFLKMCDEYNYVSIGGIVSGEIKPSQYSVFTKLIAEAHKRGAKVHGLGFTNLKGLEKYHFDSVDSTSWVSGNRFGHMYLFDGKTMQKYDKPSGMRMTEYRKAATHNFLEWVKFQRYAETHL